MTETTTRTVRLKVSPHVAQIVAADAPRTIKLQALRGETGLDGKDLLTVLFFLCSSEDREIRQTAVQTLRDLPEGQLLPLLDDAELHPQLLGLLVRARPRSVPLMRAVLLHPATPRAVQLHLAARAERPVLQQLVETLTDSTTRAELVTALLENPHTDAALRQQLLGPAETSAPLAPGAQGAGEDASPDGPQDGADEEIADEEVAEVDVSQLMAEAEEKGESKYQLAMKLRVAEKIKVALTGDKEWRSIMIKDANKLVQGAVIKNPRITDGEVLAIAKNKTASDDLIRQILLNKDWMKLYEIKRALAVHPKTPPPKAIRLIALLNTKDVKDLMRSKGVSTVVATTARKEFENRQKRIGG
ncbi:MAG: hypothetical protein RQ723_10735 [Desulfuromonadales bacterium]|nr:hypothetical protein [Desulfuromonadales bacterium]